MSFDLDGNEIDPETEAYWIKEIERIMENKGFDFKIDKIRVVQQILNDGNLWNNIEDSISAYVLDQKPQPQHHH